MCSSQHGYYWWFWFSLGVWEWTGFLRHSEYPLFQHIIWKTSLPHFKDDKLFWKLITSQRWKSDLTSRWNLSDLASRQQLLQFICWPGWGIAVYQICSLFAPSSSPFCLLEAMFWAFRAYNTKFTLKLLFFFFFLPVNSLHIAEMGTTELGLTFLSGMSSSSKILSLLFDILLFWCQGLRQSFMLLSLTHTPSLDSAFPTCRWDLHPTLCHISRFFFF